MKKLSFYLLSLLMISFVFVACEDDEDPTPDVKARFTATADAENPLLIHFTNDSQNAISYEWNFGDESAVSTEEEPSHTYAEPGTYTVSLTATGKDGEDVSTKQVVVEGMTLMQFLAGTEATGKTWQLEFNDLIIMFSPDGNFTYWYGWSSLAIAQRNTVRHWEFTFKPDGSFTYDSKGYSVRPGDGGYSTPYLFDSETTPVFEDGVDSWIAQDGKDCSAWGTNTSGDYTFAISDATKYAAYCDKKITLTGTGAHIGPMDTGTDLVVDEPAASTYYEIAHYADGGDQPDTLILYTPWGSNESGPGATRGALGVIKLVSYKNAGQIPDDEEEPTGKPLEENDIYDTFDAAGTMTWAMQDEGSGDALDEEFANPSATGINTSSLVAKYYKSGNFQYTNAQFIMDFRMDLSTRNVFTMKVYYPSGETADKKVAVKLQDSTQGANAWQTQTEVVQTFTEEDTWVELTFDFSAVSDNTAYDQIVVQFGGEASGAPAGTFYFDDFELQTATK